MRTWQYLQNTFLNATESSYLLMLNISTFHINALKTKAGDPFFDALITVYQPLHDAFVAKYTAWKNAGGTQEAQTLTVNQLLALSTSKLNGWEPDITKQFPKGSSGYIQLFPLGRKPFTTGIINKRIAAFSTLAQALKPTTALAAVYTDVLAFYTQLTTARDTQEQLKNGTNEGSSDVEAARIAACVEMYGNLGYLMYHYMSTPDTAGNFFDQENIRNAGQVVFTGHVKTSSVHFILEHGFAATDELTLSNTGNTTLVFYLSANKTSLPPTGTGITLAPGAVQLITADKLGVLANHYLLVYNADSINKGAYEVDLE